MGKIEGDIALESWLFGFRPCSGQGQFTLLAKMRTEPKMTVNFQLHHSNGNKQLEIKQLK